MKTLINKRVININVPIESPNKIGLIIGEIQTDKGNIYSVKFRDFIETWSLDYINKHLCYKITELSQKAQIRAINDFRDRTWAYDEVENTIIQHVDNEFYLFTKRGKLIEF